MTLEVIERPAITVVGMNIRTKPMSPEIPALWPKFVARIDEIENPAEPRVSYGVMRAPAAMQVLEYMAAVSVTSADRVPEGMESLVIPAGTYTACRYPLSGLAKGIGEIFNRLLPQSDYVHIPGTSFERYDESFDARNPGSLVEICFPVRSRAKGMTA